MKTLPGNGKVSGLTLIELLVVIALIVILAAMLLPAFADRGSRHAPGISCLNNQRQIAIGLIMFEEDHAGKFPAQVSMTNGGSLEFAASGPVATHFQSFASYFGKNPLVLICRSDTARHVVTNFSKLKSENISYFLNLDVATNINSILSGDRHLEFNGKPVGSGIFEQTTNTPLNWSTGFHGSNHEQVGYFSFGDGHAQLVHQPDLNLSLQKQPCVTNRFCFP